MCGAGVELWYFLGVENNFLHLSEIDNLSCLFYILVAKDIIMNSTMSTMK
uniref:Uncharacterized protein n=1 Tax=Arundo donax TaxID=35708 RepID=A0A0A9F3T0_ARUDO